MGRRAFSLVAALAALLGFPGEGEACSIAPNEGYETNPSSDDSTAPGTVAELTYEVERGEQSGGCGKGSSSCDDLGILQLHITPPEDDRTPRDDLGYRVRVVDGIPPDGINLSEDSPMAFRGSGETRSSFTYSWIEEEGVAGEPFRFAVKVAAVDRAGNLGAWSEPFVIEDPGDNFFGCAVGRRQGGGWGLGLLLGVAAAAGGRRMGRRSQRSRRARRTRRAAPRRH